MNKGLNVKILFLWFLLFPFFAQARQDLTLEQIAEGVYVHFAPYQFPDRHNHGEIANIGFIVGEQCVAVIDTGGSPAQGRALKNAIVKVTDKPVCYVINTHVHPDHIYGNSAFKQPGVQFVGHTKLPRAMATRGQYYLERSEDQLGFALKPEDIIPPDITVDSFKVIDLGNREIILTAHPTAHTDNDLSVYDKKTDTLWLSDLLFVTHVPTLDGSLKGWLAEIAKLEKHSYRFVIPGHGPLVTQWPEAIQPEKRYLQTLLTDIRNSLAKGEYLEQAVKTVGQSEKKRWKLFEKYHYKNVTTAFAELEWED